MVSVSIVTYNGEKYIKKCLESVLNQSYNNFEIIIIDNNSKDKTRDIINELANLHSHIKKIFNDENLGFSRGHNIGIKNAKGDYILCLNQDAFLDKNFLLESVKVMESDSTIGSIQGKVFRLDDNWKPTNILDTTGLIILKNRRIIARDQGLNDEIAKRNSIEEIFGADGAAPFYRKIALEDVKLTLNNISEYFDEDFFLYKEDVDLAWRLRLYCWRCIYVPTAIAFHRRTAGDSAALNYLDILKERLKINKMAKYYSFKNQRLLLIKNEMTVLMIKHVFWWLPKEIGAWLWALCFEQPYILKAIFALIKQIPKAFKKRKIIMKGKKISAREMERWFQ